MKNISYRPATKADIHEIAELISVAGGGVVEFLLHDLIPNVSAIQMLAKQMEDEKTEFYFGHCLIASQNGSIVGIAQSCHTSLLHKPPPGLLPADRIKHLDTFYNIKLPESLYLFALAIKPEARHQGIGTHFLALIKNKTRKMNLLKITLHVWKDNENAIHLYKKAGFNIINTIDIARHEFLPHDSGLLVMSCDIKD